MTFEEALSEMRDGKHVLYNKHILYRLVDNVLQFRHHEEWITDKQTNIQDLLHAKWSIKQSLQSIELFSKNYDGESIVDVQRDILEAFDERFNETWKQIPSDEYSIPEGLFTVTIKWKSE